MGSKTMKMKNRNMKMKKRKRRKRNGKKKKEGMMIMMTGYDFCKIFRSYGREIRTLREIWKVV